MEWAGSSSGNREASVAAETTRERPVGQYSQEDPVFLALADEHLESQINLGPDRFISHGLPAYPDNCGVWRMHASSSESDPVASVSQSSTCDARRPLLVTYQATPCLPPHYPGSGSPQ